MPRETDAQAALVEPDEEVHQALRPLQIPERDERVGRAESERRTEQHLLARLPPDEIRIAVAPQIVGAVVVEPRPRHLRSILGRSGSIEDGQRFPAAALQREELPRLLAGFPPRCFELVDRVGLDEAPEDSLGALVGRVASEGKRLAGGDEGFLQFTPAPMEDRKLPASSQHPNSAWTGGAFELIEKPVSF